MAQVDLYISTLVRHGQIYIRSFTLNIASKVSKYGAFQSKYWVLEKKESSWTLTNSRMEPVPVKEALSLLDRVHFFSIQNEEDGSLQHAIEGIIS